MIPRKVHSDLLGTVSLPIQERFLTSLVSTLLFCPLLRLSRSLKIPYDAGKALFAILQIGFYVVADAERLT
jgi:hypothetical protein